MDGWCRRSDGIAGRGCRRGRVHQGEGGRGQCDNGGGEGGGTEACRGSVCKCCLWLRQNATVGYWGCARGATAGGEGRVHAKSARDAVHECV